MKRLLIVLCAPLLLTGCLLSPGRFVSELRLLDNDRFAFTYEGEIEMLALSKLAKMAEGEEQVFEAECYDDEWDIRECTSADHFPLVGRQGRGYAGFVYFKRC